MTNLRAVGIAFPSHTPALVVLGSLALAGCSPDVLDPQGPVGAAEKTILVDSLVIMLAIVVPTLLAIWSFAWWFRASNPRAHRLPDWDYSGRIELVVWSIPLLTILLLGGVIWIGSYQLDPAEPLASKVKPLDVQVVSLDWKWLFIYPDLGIAAVNMLVVPAGTPLHFTLTSASVMNAFFVPRLGSMIYTMNGMATQLNLQADREGVYAGLSSHFSGDGFAGMHFELRAVTPAAFAGWVERVRRAGPVLDDNAYAALTRPSADVPPATFQAAKPGLFRRVVSQALAPAPGPPTDQSSQHMPPPPER
jgi:cytochrome o ubiquinol oxidase subunit 2